MKLYNASASAIKAVDKGISVGGPATEHLNIENFLSQAKEYDAPVDFVSTHNYPTGPRGDASGCPQHSSWTPDCFVNDVLRARELVSSKPFYITEYSVQGEPVVNDCTIHSPPEAHLVITTTASGLGYG